MAGYTPFLYELPTTTLQEEIESAHKKYHEQDRLKARQARKLGELLLRSPNLHHQMDAGWIHLQAALKSTSEKQQTELLSKTEAAWETAHSNSRDKATKLEASLALAYLPSYREHLSYQDIDTVGALRRVGEVNHELLQHKSLKDSDLVGLAPEIATLTLLLRQAVISNRPELMAWPSMTWQDRHHNDRKSANFDIAVGEFPVISHKIQVKSFLDQRNAIKATESFDGDTLLDYWHSQYDSDISFVFGDVHLGNNRSNPYSINETLLNPSKPANTARMDIATSNILDELHLV